MGKCPVQFGLLFYLVCIDLLAHVACSGFHCLWCKDLYLGSKKGPSCLFSMNGTWKIFFLVLCTVVYRCSYICFRFMKLMLVWRQKLETWQNIIRFVPTCQQRINTELSCLVWLVTFTLVTLLCCSPLQCGFPLETIGKNHLLFVQWYLKSCSAC